MIDAPPMGDTGAVLFRTNNLDVAAFLHVRGMEPCDVVIGRKEFREYYFAPQIDALELSTAFWDDAAVPVRQFIAARRALKICPARTRAAAA